MNGEVVLFEATNGQVRLDVRVELLVAESDPGQKDLMIRLVLNLMEDGSA